MMKLTKITNDQDDNSIFEMVRDISFEKDKILGALSEAFPVKKLLFHEFSDQFKDDWHTPPLGPIYVIFMTGKQEIEVSTGDKRVFGVGDIVLFEDMKGAGHRSKALEAGLSVILKA